MLQQHLQDARVMVVGCGALGNEVLKNLTLMGVGHLVLVDMDVVEPSNLTRSVLFRRSDVGRSKVQVVSRRLRELNPDLDVLAIEGDIAHDVGLGLIGQMDVVISCVDNRWARFIINRHCMRMHRIWVDGGISQWEGTVRVFAPGRNCYACQLSTEEMRELRRRMPCQNTIRRMEAVGSAPTSSILASVIGAVEVQEALKVICQNRSVGEEKAGISLCGRMFCYEGEYNTTRIVDFGAYDDDCPEHDEWTPRTRRPINTQMTVAELLADSQKLLLREDCWVDYIVDRKDETRYEMRCPGREVARRMEVDPLLCGRLLSDFYQHEYTVVDDRFPYRELTLSELGIPEWDVLQIDDTYVEACPLTPTKQ